MGEYLDTLASRGVGFNVVPLTSHGAVRIAVMGFAAGEPTSEQMRKMKTLVRESLAEGAFGLSAGLIYAPGMYASTDELVAVSEPLRAAQGVFTCHARGSSETGLESTAEIIEIARRNGIPAEHSHVEEFGEPYWQNIDRVIELHDEARASGIDVSFDVIPYTTANTTLGACFPPYAFEGGVDALRRAAARSSGEGAAPPGRGDDGVGVAHLAPGHLAAQPGQGDRLEEHPASVGGLREERGLSGQELRGDRRAQEGKTPFDAAADLLVDEHGAALALYVGVSGDLEDDSGLRKFLAHPNGAINTDAILTGKGIPHPAAYGAFPRVLGHFVREARLMRLEEAVRKMTSLPLRRFNIQDRGVIREGMWADITVFDPDTIQDNSTYLEPAQSPSGIEYVVVNGEVTVERGKLSVAAPAGRVLRR